jgi:hypothetical protein
MMVAMDAGIPFTLDADGRYHLTADGNAQMEGDVLADVAEVAASFSESTVLGLNQSATGLEKERPTRTPVPRQNRCILAGLLGCLGKV